MPNPAGLQGVDYAVIAAYFAATLLIGLWSVRRARRASSKGFFVAEQALPWWVIGFTMVAANISAEQMLGQIGYATSAGLVVSNWDLGVYPALMLMVFIFLPLYLRSGITTIPEYLERRYGQTTRLLFAVYTVFNNACITLVMVLALGAIALKSFLGVPLWLGVALLIASTGLYTVAGGMLSVAWTQTLQCLLLLIGGLTVTFAGLAKTPGGLAGLLERMGEQNLDHLVRPASDPFVPWPGLLLLMLSTNVWYCCTNQFYVQSCLGAKDERHGRLGVLFTAFLAPVLTFCFAVPGYTANDLLGHGLLAPLPLTPQGQPDYDSTYPHLVHQLLGPGLRGFLVAAVIGAIMSSVAAIVNATASVFSNDLYRRWFRPGAGDRELVRAGRWTGLATMAVAFPLALVAIRYKFIFTYSQNAWCILAIPIMLVFTFGALWKRATNAAATWTFAIIMPFVAVPFVFGNKDDNYLQLPFATGRVHLFNFAFVLWLAAAAFMLVVSLLARPRPSEEVAAYVWGTELNRHIAAQPVERAWYQQVAFWAIMGGVVFVAIYAWLW